MLLFLSNIILRSPSEVSLPVEWKTIASRDTKMPPILVVVNVCIRDPDLHASQFLSTMNS
jgi:hypothetical protein